MAMEEYFLARYGVSAAHEDLRLRLRSSMIRKFESCFECPIARPHYVHPLLQFLAGLGLEF